MRRRSILKLVVPVLAALAFLAAWQIIPATAEQEAKGTQTGATKARFLVISPHTAEQCLAALDAILAMPAGEADLAKWDWGCMAGDHTGYMMAEGASLDEIMKRVPENVRQQAKAIKLNKFTAEQIRSFHEH